MVEVIFLDKFKNIFYWLKDNLLKKKIIKQVEKIKNNQEVGKPMRNVRKGTRELYLNPFRISYKYFVNEDLIVSLKIYHKDKQ